MSNRIIALFASCVLLISCGVSTQSCCKDNASTPLPDAEPIALTKAQAAMSSGINGFGVDLLRELYSAESGKDVFISPLSISLALSMTAGGAKGETASEMTSALGFEGFAPEEVSAFYKYFVDAILAVDPSTTLEVANSIWTDKSIKILKYYSDYAAKYYGSDVKNVDFSKVAAIKAVNQWCSDKTHGKIKSILEDSDLGLAVVLANALYFNGTWRFEFSGTERDTFHGISADRKEDFMYVTSRFRYGESAGFQAVDLPYGNGAFCLTVLLPAEGADFGKAVASLTPAVWSTVTGSMYSNEVNLRLPKWKLEYKASLREYLEALGMRLAFTGAADFSGMSDTPMCIDFVRHKTFIDVNEKGTEAAAVTAVGMKATSAGPGFGPVPFVADRPFVYAIRERSTGAVIFIGTKL